MPVSKNLYDVLGLPQDATDELIREAYLGRLAWLRSNQHGLSADDALNQYKAVEEAFATLNDPSRRTLYDLSLRKEERGEGLDTSWNPWGWAALAVVLCAVGGGYQWYKHEEARREIARQEAIVQGEERLREERQRERAEEIASQAQRRADDNRHWQEQRTREEERMSVERLRSDTDWSRSSSRSRYRTSDEGEDVAKAQAERERLAREAAEKEYEQQRRALRGQ